MKNLLFLLFILLPFYSKAQIKVKTDNSVSIGPSYVNDTRLNVYNTDKLRGWYQYHNVYSTTSLAHIGIDNAMASSTDHQQIGIKNTINNRSTNTATSYGILNYAYMDGSGAWSAGIQNITVTSASSSGTKVGFYNQIMGTNGNQGTGNRYAFYSTGGSLAGYFNGNIWVTGTYNGSDRELKEDIQDLSDPKEKFLQIKSRKYKLKKDKDKKTHYGFVAQEIEELFPELVEEFVQPGEIIYAQEENEHGELVNVEVGREPEQSFKGVNYIEMMPILVKMVQEQTTTIQEQAAKIDDLEKRLEKLEKK